MTTTTADLRQQIIELAAHKGDCSYSILVPTHRTHPDNQQDPIRWKNALDEVQAALTDRGMRESDIERMLRPLRGHLDDRTFWQHRSLGLAAFGSPDTGPIELDVPFRLEAETRVADRFHFRPLLTGLEDHSVPAILLARGGVAMYEVDRDGAHRLEVDLPESMEDVNWFVDREPRLQQRTQPPSQTGSGFHGHSPDEDEDEDLRRYLAAIADAVSPILRDRAWPLVVSAGADLSAKFERIVDHETVGVVALDPEASVVDVAELASPVREELIRARRESGREELAAAIGRGQATTDLEEVVFAGLDGRIEVLGLVVEASPMWGKLDESTRELSIHDERQDGDVDLLDVVAGLTLIGGGRVEPLHEPVQQCTVMAVTRY